MVTLSVASGFLIFEVQDLEPGSVESSCPTVSGIFLYVWLPCVFEQTVECSLASLFLPWSSCAEAQDPPDLALDPPGTCVFFFGPGCSSSISPTSYWKKGWYEIAKATTSPRWKLVGTIALHFCQALNTTFSSNRRSMLGGKKSKAFQQVWNPSK
jgi:hypothetical protein